MNRIDRRRLLLSSSLVIAALPRLNRASSQDRPPVTNPRATDGDAKHQPNWDQRVTITVGTKNADLVGDDDKVIQAAVDYVSRFDGGTVRILDGTYVLRSAIQLVSNTRILGSGPETIITKCPSETVELAEDSDWYDQEITLRKPAGFQVGDGVLLKAKNPHHGGQQVIKRTLIAKAGNRFKLSDGLRENLWLSENPTCSSLFPLLTAERASDVHVENLTLDGNRENNINLNGNFGGNVFLQDCNRFTFRNIESRNFNGDGLSFQICHDVVVDQCYVHDNADLGVHPGSGSQRPLIRDCRIDQNNLGIFWCWGVKYGVAENNKIAGNRSYGISIGHNDTDNVIRNNDIAHSGKVGILFRDDSRGKDFWANRNTIEQNRIVDSGGSDGVAIDIRGNTKDVTIRDNQIRETRGPEQRTAIRIDPSAERITLANNRIEGFAHEVIDQRSTPG